MYDHYIAIDWAQSNMAIGRMTPASEVAKITEGYADVADIKAYLRNLRGSKAMTIEETNSSHWLYTELKPFVDHLVICDPYRNRLLLEGAKNDRIDAGKLAYLLRGNFVKPVFHSNDRFIKLRKLVSAYDDLVQRGVRLKNQRSALLRSVGKAIDCKEYDEDQFILDNIDTAIEAYEGEKKTYEAEFKKLAKQEITIRRLQKIPGIGLIGAVKIIAIVVDTKRFSHRNRFLSYCGLVRLEKSSGGRSYGSRLPRYRRDLKSVFKIAALAAIGGDNCFKDEYCKLIHDLRYSDHKARHAIARRIATAVYGMLRQQTKFEPGKVKARFQK